MGGVSKIIHDVAGKRRTAHLQLTTEANMNKLGFAKYSASSNAHTSRRLVAAEDARRSAKTVAAAAAAAATTEADEWSDPNFASLRGGNQR